MHFFKTFFRNEQAPGILLLFCVVIYLGFSAVISAFLLILNRANVQKLVFYLIPGLLLWYCLHHSGIHATMAGVILAFTIPVGNGDSSFQKLEHFLRLPVSFLIMPLFALTNTNITVTPEIGNLSESSLGIGIIGGLFIGKVLGITSFTAFAVFLKLAVLPENSSWRQMIGTGFLAGIGFTMSIFIATLSFSEIEVQDEAKTAVLIASVLSGITGYIILKSASPAERSAH